MLTTELTAEKIAKWQQVYSQYQGLLRPNKKSAQEVIEYLQQKYPVFEIADDTVKQVVIDNVVLNQYHAEKIPPTKTPWARVFAVERIGTGQLLYEQQDDIFLGNTILVGVEFTTAFMMAEGSSLLRDELTAFQGLDETDLGNYYLVADYIACLNRFNMLEDVLAQA